METRTMKLILPAALALSLAMPVAAAAFPLVRADAVASEQGLLVKIGDKPKHRGKGHKHGGGERWDDRRDESRAYRQGLRDGRREGREQAYYQPGYREDYRRYGRGQYLPREYRTYVVDYGRYGYPPPPRGSQYVRVGQDTYLTQMTSGLILNVFLGGGY
jgi:Ni/Co efflux regulator RcnB